MMDESCTGDGAHLLLDGDTGLHGAPEEVGDLLKIALNQTAGGERRCPETDGAGSQRVGVTVDGVLVERDADGVAEGFHLVAVDAERPQVPQHEMVGGATYTMIMRRWARGVGVNGPDKGVARSKSTCCMSHT